MPSRDWRTLAVRAVSSLLTSELAAVKSEIEAKVSERAWEGVGAKIDPHHVTNALKTLQESGFLEIEEKVTRGGRSIPVVRLGETHRRQRAVAAAAARKRLLQARYLGWASGTKTGGLGVIGPALESVVHQSLTAAAPYGYRLAKPEGGEISQLLGSPVRYGALDNAAFLTVLDGRTYQQTGSYWIPIEAKNLRLRIYPIHPELHQLLAKSAQLQIDHPDLSFVPTLVCRRAHFLTFTMAQALGFHVIETRRQYIRPHVAQPDPKPLNEVIDELGYELEPHDQAVTPMVDQFVKTMPRRAADAAQRWAQIAGPCAAHFAALRKDSRWQEREYLLNEIAATAASIFGEPQRWRQEDAYLDPGDYDGY